MDDQLFEALSNATMDAPGIDWAAFEQKRDRKKRRAIIIWFSVAGIMLCGGVLSFFVASHSSSAISGKADVGIAAGNIQHGHLSDSTLLLPGREVRDSIPLIARNKPIIQEVNNKRNQMNAERRYVSAVPGLNSGESLKDVLTKRVTADTFDPLRIRSLVLAKLPYDYTSISMGQASISQLKRVKHEGSHMFIQFQAGPSFNFPQFNINELGKAFIHKDYSVVRKGAESGLAGYGFQALAGFTFHQLDLSLGLGISQARVDGHYDFVYSEKPIINMDGTIAGYNMTNPAHVSFNSRQNYTFAEFPLYIDYTIISRNKMKTAIHAGLINQFLKGISGELPNALFMDRKDRLSPENFKSYAANIELGLRFLMPYNKRVHFALTPVYRKNFGIRQAQSFYSNTFNSLGIQFLIKTYL